MTREEIQGWNHFEELMEIRAKKNADTVENETKYVLDNSSAYSDLQMLILVSLVLADNPKFKKIIKGLGYYD